MNISFTTIIVNEVQISIKLELRGKKIKTNIINEKKNSHYWLWIDG